MRALLLRRDDPCRVRTRRRRASPRSRAVAFRADSANTGTAIDRSCRSARIPRRTAKPLECASARIGSRSAAMICAAYASSTVRSGISDPLNGSGMSKPSPCAPRNDVDVIVRLVLSRRRAAVHDDVQVIASRHFADGVRQPHRHLEEVHPNLFGDVEQRFVVLARHDQHVPVVHRLNVHERDCVRVLVADRHLGGAVDQVAERAVRTLASSGPRRSVSYRTLSADAGASHLSRR